MWHKVRQSRVMVRRGTEQYRSVMVSWRVEPLSEVKALLRIVKSGSVE